MQRTDSNRCYDIAEGTVRQVQNTDRLLVGCTDCKYGGQRLERAGFNFLCAVSKIRFVTIDCDDAHCCNEQIKTFTAKFRKCDRPFEATIVCSKIVLVTANSTLYDTDCNEINERIIIIG